MGRFTKYQCNNTKEDTEMASRFSFTVEVEVERTQGKFASRDEIESTLREWIEGANEGTVDGVGADGDSEYEVVDWSVT